MAVTASAVIPEAPNELREAPPRPDQDSKPAGDKRTAPPQARETPPERAGEAGNASAAKRDGKKPRAPKAGKADLITRYFLTKPGNNGTPELDRELEDENQAMIEALKLDRTYVIVTEWRIKMDCSVAGKPVIGQEPVIHEKN